MNMSPEQPHRLQDMQSLPDCVFRRQPDKPGRVLLTIVQSGAYRFIMDGEHTVLQVEQTSPYEQPTTDFPAITQADLDASV